ncbi:AcrR family transcriptional regulator [Nakamurella sp. UYEF19]|uniref:TetR/AcrR family transcriptional regulator n=1 Tax=Nakamurella sp. UYEF19 TaxID=1756392 RepID=UPI0033987577
MNRERILVAARKALAHSGEASLQSIAKSAGVGQGTLYRHFATREALVLAVHRKDVQELIEAAPQLAAALPAPVAIREWLDRLASYGRIKHGLADALDLVIRQKLADEGYDSIIGAMSTLLDAGQSTGTVRHDIDAEEMLLLVGFLWRLDTDDRWEARSRHLLDLVMDCLTPRMPA